MTQTLQSARSEGSHSSMLCNEENCYLCAACDTAGKLEVA